MLPSHHAAATAAMLLPLARGGWRLPALAGFAAGAVLLDVDHYLYYVWKTGDWSLVRAYWYHRSAIGPWRWSVWPRRPELGWQQTRPLHAVPLLALALLATRRTPALRPLIWGALFHRLLDVASGAFTVPDEPGPAAGARECDGD